MTILHFDIPIDDSQDLGGGSRWQVSHEANYESWTPAPLERHARRRGGVCTVLRLLNGAADGQCLAALTNWSLVLSHVQRGLIPQSIIVSAE
jgi:hypothetical protein